MKSAIPWMHYTWCFNVNAPGHDASGVELMKKYIKVQLDRSQWWHNQHGHINHKGLKPCLLLEGNYSQITQQLNEIPEGPRMSKSWTKCGILFDSMYAFLFQNDWGTSNCIWIWSGLLFYILNQICQFIIEYEMTALADISTQTNHGTVEGAYSTTALYYYAVSTVVVF